MTRRAAVGGLALLALTACGGTTDEQVPDTPAAEEQSTQDDGPTGDSPAEESEQTEEEIEDATEDPSGAGEEGAEVQIGETFTDPETGDSITIISALRDMPTERDAIYLEEGGEVVYLQLEVTPGDTYGGMLSTNDFSIQYDGNEDRAKTTLAEEISAAGYEPMESIARRDGAAGPVWLAFTVESDREDSYTGVYLRPETKILGEDTVVPEFRHEYTIPAP